MAILIVLTCWSFFLPTLNHMWLPLLWLGISWIGYGALHSILASKACKDYFAQKNPSLFRFYRLVYMIIAFITLLPPLYLLYQSPGFLCWEPGLISMIAGLLCILPGLFIIAKCLYLYLGTIKGIRDLVTEKPGQILFRNGLHSRIRHPLYLGTFLFLWGIFIVLPYSALLLTNIIVTLYTLLGIRFEEKKLRAEFGETYSRYLKEVPMILPRLGKKSN